MSDLFLQPLFTWRSAVASEFGPESPTTRHVLLTLGLHMNEKGESCFPSIPLLVIETALSERAVKSHIRIGADAGWIGKRALRKPNGQGWRRVEYFALIPKEVERAFHDKQRSAGDAPPQGEAPSAPRQAGAPDSKGGAGRALKVVQDVHPSTSVSSSITPKSPAARRTSLPADFKISEQVRAWAKEKGFEQFLPGHLEKFLSSVKASGRRYVDWDEAFINCIRDDWGDVRRNAARAAGIVPALVPKPKILCRYCTAVSHGNVGGIHHCANQDHFRMAMDGEPAPAKVAA